MLWALEGPQHLQYFLFHARRAPLWKRHRVVIGILLSVACIGFWVLIGVPWMVLFLMGFNIYNSMVSSSLRGAVEHHSYPGDPNFANEYKTWIPLFNLNRHIDHYLTPDPGTCCGFVPPAIA